MGLELVGSQLDRSRQGRTKRVRQQLLVREREERKTVDCDVILTIECISTEGYVGEIGHV